MLAGMRALRGRPAGLRPSSITHPRIASMYARSNPPPSLVYRPSPSPPSCFRRLLGMAAPRSRFPVGALFSEEPFCRHVCSLPVRLPEDQQPRTMSTTNLPVKHTDSSLGAPSDHSAEQTAAAPNEFGRCYRSVRPLNPLNCPLMRRVRRDWAGRAGQLGTQRQHVADDFRARMMRGGDDAGRYVLAFKPPRRSRDSCPPSPNCRCYSP